MHLHRGLSDFLVNLSDLQNPIIGRQCKISLIRKENRMLAHTQYKIYVAFKIFNTFKLAYVHKSDGKDGKTLYWL